MAQLDSRCWCPLSSQDHRLGSLLEESTPRGPESRARTSPQATESAGERVGAHSLEDFPGFKLSLSELPGALAFVSRVGAEGQKMSPCTSFPRSSPGPGEPTLPQALLAARSPHPAGGCAGVPGGWGTWNGSGHGPSADSTGRGRAEGHSPSGGRRPGPARTTQKAAQVPRLRGREFESRSRKRLRLPAAPAHCQPLGPGRGQLQALPPGTPARAPVPSARQEVGAEPGLQPEEERGRGGPGMFPVGGDSGPAGIQQLAAPQGARGNFAALRAGARGEGCGGGWAPERLMINACRWGKRAARCQPCRKRAEALRGSLAAARYKEARGGGDPGVTDLISLPPERAPDTPNIPHCTDRKGGFPVSYWLGSDVGVLIPPEQVTLAFLCRKGKS